jgi:hypothetical protein
MPIDRYGHKGPDPIFPSAFWNGREWDMAATGLNINDVKFGNPQSIKDFLTSAAEEKRNKGMNDAKK